MNLKLYRLKVFSVSASAMAVYEMLKEQLFLNISVWESHVITILAVSSGVTLASFFFVKKARIKLPASSVFSQHPPLVSTAFNKKQWLAATVFDTLENAVIITDKDNHIIAFNSAFTKINDDPEEQVLGKKPNILSSGGYTTDFYQEFWNTLCNTGRWDHEIWHRRKDGEICALWFSIKRVYDELGNFSHHVGIFSDLNQQTATFERIQHLMYYDVLTDLPNKSLFMDRFQRAIANAKREDNLTAVLYLKLDKFEHITSEFGFDIADQLLKAVSNRLRELVQRKSDTISVSRMGGDEFVVLLAVIEKVQNAFIVAENIRDTLYNAFEINGHSIHVSVSIGIAVFPEHGDNEHLLLTNANRALDEARYNTGGNRVMLYQKLVGV